MKRLALILAVLAVSLAPPVAAQAYPAGENVVDAATLMAEGAARDYWGTQIRCPTGMRVQYSNAEGVPFADASSGAGVLAWSTLDDPLCVIHLNEEVWSRDNPERAEMRIYQWFCDVIVHEAGHFAGIPDGGPSTSIMNAILEEGSPNYGSVPECVNHRKHRHHR